MSLKSVYFDGMNGLQQSLSNAFDAGVAFVGTGQTEISSLALGDRNGSNMGAGSANPGIYFDIDGPSIGYRVWIYVAGEVAPSSAGRTLVQVTVASGATSAQAAQAIATALSALSGAPFNVTVVGNSIQMETSAPKTVANIITLSSGWGTAVATEVQAGSDPTGNYSAIYSALLAAAAAGQTCFVVSLQTTYNPTALRNTKPGSYGNNSNCSTSTFNCNTGSCNNKYGSCNCSSNGGGNSLLNAYFAGIQKGLSDQDLYSYEVKPTLNLNDTVSTYVDLNFSF